MTINLLYSKCEAIYDWETGKIDFNDDNAIFEHVSVCPKCGAKDHDLLTELGQSQMTDFWLSDDE